MTHFIPVHSLKHDKAVRFGAELTKAMQARGVGRRPIADAVGCGQSAVQQWRGGFILPRIAMAQKLAEALEWPRLASLAVELRRKRCIVDDVEFVDDSGSDNRLYCSVGCQKVKDKSRVGVDRRTRAHRAELALKAHRDAVAAFCASCEPAGRCFAPECELRPVSPLPLVDEARPRVQAVQPRGNGWVEAENRRIAASDAQKAIWGRLSPEERQARIDRTAEASRRARGLVAS